MLSSTSTMDAVGIMKEYVHLDFGSVDKRYVRDIAETCLIFQSFSFSNQYLEERSVVALCGRGLGNPRIAHLTYHLSKIKNGINIQVARTSKSESFDFGVIMFNKDGCLPPYTGFLPYTQKSKNQGMII